MGNLSLVSGEHIRLCHLPAQAGTASLRSLTTRVTEALPRNNVATLQDVSPPSGRPHHSYGPGLTLRPVTERQHGAGHRHRRHAAHRRLAGRQRHHLAQGPVRSRAVHRGLLRHRPGLRPHEQQPGIRGRGPPRALALSPFSTSRRVQRSGFAIPSLPPERNLVSLPLQHYNLTADFTGLTSLTPDCLSTSPCAFAIGAVSGTTSGTAIGFIRAPSNLGLAAPRRASRYRCHGSTPTSSSAPRRALPATSPPSSRALARSTTCATRRTIASGIAIGAGHRLQRSDCRCTLLTATDLYCGQRAAQLIGVYRHPTGHPSSPSGDSTQPSS